MVVYYKKRGVLMYHIIYNPESGKGKRNRAFEKVKEYLMEQGKEFVEHPTQSKGHATEFVRALTCGTEPVDIIVVGGDGTFSEALNGVVNFDNVTFGLIPSGTGNDYARKTGIPTDPVKALDAVFGGKAIYSDYIQLSNGERVFNVAGAGMDVDVLVRYANMKHFKGRIKYYLSLFDTLIHLKFHKIKLTVDGKSEEHTVFMIAVANGTYIGGGMPISPNSVVDDGLLDVVYVNQIKPSQILPALLGFLKGKHIDKDYTVSFRAEKAVVEVLDEGKIQIDGEVKDEKLLDAEIVHNKLKLYR